MVDQKEVQRLYPLPYHTREVHPQVLLTNYWRWCRLGCLLLCTEGVQPKVSGGGFVSPAVRHYQVWLKVTVFFFFFFSSSHSLSSPMLSCSLPVVTQVRGHVVGSSAPSPLRYVPRHFYREQFLPSSTRVDCTVRT